MLGLCTKFIWQQKKFKDTKGGNPKPEIKEGQTIQLPREKKGQKE